MERMSYEEWREKYDPIRDVDDVRVFETYGEDLALINLIYPFHVWTLIDADEEDEEGFSVEYLVAGIRHADRMLYVVTKKSWEFEGLTADW